MLDAIRAVEVESHDFFACRGHRARLSVRDMTNLLTATLAFARPPLLFLVGRLVGEDVAVVESDVLVAAALDLIEPEVLSNCEECEGESGRLSKECENEGDSGPSIQATFSGFGDGVARNSPARWAAYKRSCLRALYAKMSAAVNSSSASRGRATRSSVEETEEVDERESPSEEKDEEQPSSGVENELVRVGTEKDRFASSSSMESSSSEV